MTGDALRRPTASFSGASFTIMALFSGTSLSITIVVAAAVELMADRNMGIAAAKAFMLTDGYYL